MPENSWEDRGPLPSNLNFPEVCKNAFGEVFQLLKIFLTQQN